MKTSLQLKMSQQLTMTPQLQQAIRLLQLSTLDLQQEIQEALESNPMLEVREDVDDSGAADSKNSQSVDQKASSDAENTANSNEGDQRELEIAEHIPDDLAVDSSWDDIYTHAPTSHGLPSGDDDFNFENVYGTTDSLWDHLNWQLNLTTMTDRDRQIAESLIESVNAEGYLSSSLDDIFEGLTAHMADADDPLEMDEVEALRPARRLCPGPGRLPNHTTEANERGYPLARRRAYGGQPLPRLACLARLQPTDAQIETQGTGVTRCYCADSEPQPATR